MGHERGIREISKSHVLGTTRTTLIINSIKSQNLGQVSFQILILKRRSLKCGLTVNVINKVQECENMVIQR